MKRIFSIAMLVALSTLGVRAQSTVFGGEVISPANMSHMEAAKFSQTEHTFMSARVAAMGGAFTSLGADLSSMAINPAGLGMYRSSEIALSLSFDHTSATNNESLTNNTSNNVSFNQIGAALNLYQSSGPLVSFTLGFGYTKLADLNYHNTARWGMGNVTIGEFFAEQMYGFDPTVLNASADPFRNNNIYPDEWGGVLAYQTYLIDPNMDSSGKFLDNYLVTGVPLANKIDTNFIVTSEGSVGEYDFSAGFNISNFLYLGATLGIQDVQQFVRYSLNESYHSASGNPNEMYHLAYRPMVSTYGSGVNFKIGAILRPISALRLGVAYHTGTAMSLTRDYYTSMTTTFIDNTSYEAESLVNSYTYNYSSPSKLLLGASVSILDKAILSVDYDKVWYDDMSLHTKGLEEAFAYDVKTDLGTSDNFRVGLEVRPIKGLYLRGGYAYYGTPFNAETDKYADDGNLFFGTFKTHTSNISFGGGMRFGDSSVDLVWTISDAHFTNSVMYYYSYIDDSNDILVSGPTLTDTKHRSHNVALTYSLRF